MQVQEVTDAFSLDRVVPFFQPIMDITHNCVWRYECLARLVTLDQNAFKPSDFLYLIEQQSANQALTETIFNRSAEYFRNHTMPWSINLSESDVSSAHLANWLVNYLKHYPTPGRVGFEVSATALLNNRGQLDAFYTLCESLQIKLFIDRIQADKLKLTAEIPSAVSGVKIDIKVLAETIKQGDKAELLDSLAHCQYHQIDVIAERIEQPADLELAKELGIRYAQGFYFSRPSKAI